MQSRVRFPKRLVELTISEVCGIILSEEESERLQRGDCGALPGVTAFFVDSRVSEEIRTASVAPASLARPTVEPTHRRQHKESAQPAGLVGESEGDAQRRSLGVCAAPRLGPCHGYGSLIVQSPPAPKF